MFECLFGPLRSPIAALFVTFAAAFGSAAAAEPEIPAPVVAEGAQPGATLPSAAPPVPPQLATQPPPGVAPASPAAPPPSDPIAVLAPIHNAVNAISALGLQVEQMRASEDGLSLRRGEVEALQSDTEKAAGAVQPLIEAVRVQLEKLGPPPKDKEPPEAREVAAERARLSGQLSAFDGALKSAELVKVKARQLTARIQELRHGLFAEHLFERTESPLLPGIWRALSRDMEPARLQARAVFEPLVTQMVQQQKLAFGVLVAAGIAFAGFWLAAWRAAARLMPQNALTPGYMTRVTAACLAAPLFALPALAAAGAGFLGLQAAGLIPPRIEDWAEDVLQAVLIVIVVSALAVAVLEPRRPLWRLVNLADRPARALWSTVAGFALVYGADVVAKQTIRLLVLPLPFTVALSFLTSLAFAVLLARAALTRFTLAHAGITATALPDTVQADPAPAPAAPSRPDLVSRLAPGWLKLPLIAVAGGILVASLSGYVALGRFAAGQVVITGSAVVLALLLHLGIRTAERGIESPQMGIGGWLSRRLGYERSQRRIIGRAVSVVLHALLALAVVPGLLLAWGFSLADVGSGLKSAMFGFQIGHMRISLAQILMALAIFAAIVVATRLLQRWLQGRVLRPDRMDPGIANSIHQGIGYAGFSLAALSAVSVGGIDITNLAIVAGALSVGIGFGLQSIVNNFVSGLILLVERPIKVGDWIVVKGGGEGYVRAISVRSTEIETFDRASLIVPNSELISNVVTNWTHRNALGRVIIKVNASYKCDPDAVLRVLTEIAVASPNVMQQPPPLVTLDNLGPEALEFSIRVLVADINRAHSVQTELRTAVFHAFRRHGLEFPTPERDIYLRDLDGLKVLIARIMKERSRNQAASQATTVKAKPEG